MANEPLITSRIDTTPSAGGIVNLINPFSQIGVFKGSKDYVPSWLIKAFSSGKGRESAYETSATPAKLAHVLAKVVAGGAVFGGAALALRSFMHSLDIDNVENIKAGGRASRKLETTKLRPTAPVIASKVPQETQEEGLEKQESFTYSAAVGAIPPLAALAAMMASFKLADKTFDLSLGKRLDKELAQARSESQDLALNRVLRTRGLEQPEETETITDAYNKQLTEKAKQRKQKKNTKTASLNKKEGVLPAGMESSLGLFLAALIATGGVVGYNWQQANSPSLAKYKAYKKGLETYNKERALSENIESTPLDPEFLAYLDTNINKAKKKAPAMPAETSLKELMI